MSTTLFPRILCATDGLEHSDRAMREAAKIASATGSVLHVVHVRQAPITTVDVVMADALGRIVARSERVEAQVKQLDDEFDLSTRLHILDATRSHIATRIAKLAAKIDARLIVVGTSGRGSLVHVLRGSVSHKLPHICERPVLIVSGSDPIHLTTQASSQPPVTASLSLSQPGR